MCLAGSDEHAERNERTGRLLEGQRGRWCLRAGMRRERLEECLCAGKHWIRAEKGVREEQRRLTEFPARLS